MKKSIFVILIFSVLLNGVLVAGYIIEKNSMKSYQKLFSMNAQSAAEHFSAYNQSELNGEFIYAVADVNIMRQTMFLMKDIKDDSFIKEHFNELYGQLVLYPEKLHPYSLDLVVICELLQEDYANQNAHNKIVELLNQINHNE